MTTTIDMSQLDPDADLRLITGELYTSVTPEDPAGGPLARYMLTAAPWAIGSAEVHLFATGPGQWLAVQADDIEALDAMVHVPEQAVTGVTHYLAGELLPGDVAGQHTGLLKAFTKAGQ